MDSFKATAGTATRLTLELEPVESKAYGSFYSFRCTCFLVRSTSSPAYCRPHRNHNVKDRTRRVVCPMITYMYTVGVTALKYNRIDRTENNEIHALEKKTVFNSSSPLDLRD